MALLVTVYTYGHLHTVKCVFCNLSVHKKGWLKDVKHNIREFQVFIYPVYIYLNEDVDLDVIKDPLLSAVVIYPISFHYPGPLTNDRNIYKYICLFLFFCLIYFPLIS